MSVLREGYTLTPAGWPRPLAGGYPVPWVAPMEKLSEVNEGRRLASVGGAVCQVCGLGWEEDYPEGYGFTTLSEDGMEAPAADIPLEFGDYLSELLGSATLVMLLDGAVMHLRCARLTAARCPHVRDRADLIMVRVPANDADPQVDGDGKIRPTYPAGDVQYVPWPVKRPGGPT